MKIFNVSLRVVITQVAEISDNPKTAEDAPPEKFSDDPLTKQDRMLNKYLDRIEKMNAAGQRPVWVSMPGEIGDGASFAQNVKIAAENYEDMSAILKRFADVAQKLPAIPDGLLQQQGAPFAPIG